MLGFSSPGRSVGVWVLLPACWGEGCFISLYWEFRARWGALAPSGLMDRTRLAARRLPCRTWEDSSLVEFRYRRANSFTQERAASRVADPRRR